MSLFARLLIAALLAVFTALPAAAVQPVGSAAWTTDGWTTFSGTLYAGPGLKYGEIGSIDAGVRVRVDRCAPHWCQIHTTAVDGWVSLSNVSFGQMPDGWRVTAKFPTQRGGAGSVCFYDGPGFTGEAFCATSGRVVSDLALLGLDNTISSVEVGSGVSAIVCRDRGMRSYCEVVDVSKGRINGLLDNGITSLRVY